MLTATALLASCGGSNGSTSGPSVNTPPVITSAAAMSIVENTISVAQITATDGDGDALTYSIAGGVDAGQFTLTASGALLFRAGRNFEDPADANLDNVYEVRVAVSDGKVTTTQDVTVSVRDDPEGLTAEQLATGFSNPVAIAPYAGNVLIAQRDGTFFVVQADGTKSVVTVPLPNMAPNSLLAAAVLPGAARFQDSLRTVYVDTSGRLVLASYSFSSTMGYGPTTVTPILASVSDPTALRVQLSFPGGDLTNSLLLVVGATQAGTDGLAQDPNSPIGKLLVIDIGMTGTPLSCAAPSRCFGLGLHDVGGIGIFRTAGDGVARLAIADRGASTQEIDTITAAPGAPLNFGWPFRDGDQAGTGAPSAGLSEPNSIYFRGNGTASTQGLAGADVIGTSLIVGDRDGTIRTLPTARLVAGAGASAYVDRTATLTPGTGSIGPIALVKADVTGSAGLLYLISARGALYRVRAPAGAL